MVSMPNRWQVAMIRQAISPRLAMRTRENISACSESPGRLAFLQKGVQTLLAFARYPERCNRLRGALVQILSAIRRGANQPDQGFDAGLGFRAAGQQRFQQTLDMTVQLANRNDIRHQPDLASGCCVASLA